MQQVRRFAIPGALLIATLAFIVGPKYAGSSAQPGAARTSAVTSFMQNEDAENHEITGTWIVVNAENPRQPSAFVIFHADGTVISTDANGVSSYGAWETVDEMSVDFNVLQFSLKNRSIRGNSGPQSATGVQSLLGSATVVQDGDAFEATATRSTTMLDGNSVTEAGTISLRGTRIDATGGAITGLVTPRGTPAS